MIPVPDRVVLCKGATERLRPTGDSDCDGRVKSFKGDVQKIGTSPPKDRVVAVRPLTT